MLILLPSLLQKEARPHLQAESPPSLGVVLEACAHAPQQDARVGAQPLEVGGVSACSPPKQACDRQYEKDDAGVWELQCGNNAAQGPGSPTGNLLLRQMSTAAGTCRGRAKERALSCTVPRLHNSFVQQAKRHRQQHRQGAGGGLMTSAFHQPTCPFSTSSMQRLTNLH